MEVKININRGAKRNNDLLEFSNLLIQIKKLMSIKVSARGWCYQLENMNLIRKGDFNRIQKRVNECRKKGFLPINFVANEEARVFSNAYSFEETKTPSERITFHLKYILDGIENGHKFDFWKDQNYYIQILVEKIDLKTLFDPICKMFHIPIATTKGWGSIRQRAELINRYKEYSDKQGVLLYCGDFDPYGYLISEKLRKNLNDLEKATNWNANDLIINRFGLNYDLIEKLNLTWIDNLQSSSGKTNYKNPIVKAWIKEYGERKVEGNALIVNENAAKNLIIKNIFEYLDNDCLDKYQAKRENIGKEYKKIIENVDLDKNISKLIERIKSNETL